MGLVVPVIGAGGNVAEAKVFYSMFGNVKFQVLDLEVGLDKGLGDTGEGDEEWLKGGSHGEDYSPQQSLYSLSTARALPKFDSDSQVHSTSE